MTKDARIDDIALFFSQDGKTEKRWVPHSIYADPAYKLGPASESWLQAIFLQQPASGPGSPPFYVANLASLLDPGVGPASKSDDRSVKPSSPSRPRSRDLKPSAGDIVVIPWSDPQSAYLVPKSRYENDQECPPVSDSSGADLRFMAITEGVVLANLPKTDLAGMTCYLLNLAALRPTAAFPGKETK